jgi:hypothetical protein
MVKIGQFLAFPPGFALVVPVNATVRQKLREARGRLVWNQFLHASVIALWVGLTAAVLWRLWDRTGWLAALPWLVGVPLLAAAVAAVVRWRSWTDVARELDRRLGTKDRFFTGLRAAGPSPWTDAIQREVADYAARMRVREHLQLPGPGWRTTWLLLPLLALSLVEGWHHVRLAEKHAEIAAAREMLQKTREAVPPDDRELARAAEELEEVENRLSDAKEPLREALRALAELERKLASGSAADALTAAETAALADALAAESPQLAAELRSGNSEAAGDSVAQLDPAALARALEEAARHLENRRLEELSRDPNAQQQLGTILRMSPDGGSGNRKKFLSALRDIKQGNAGDQKNQSGEGSSEDALPMDAPDGGEKPDSGLADNAPPGGRPGSDRDLGRGGDLDTAGESDTDDSRIQEFIAGQMGDGASLVEMLRAAGGDDPRARRAWKSAWQAAAPAALDAVAREEIPPGSRLMVKRYFEAIRPKE